MSRLSTGSTIPVDKGYDNAELEQPDIDTIVELRNSLGAIPEVSKLYGTPEQASVDYENEDKESAESETEVDPYVKGVSGLHADPLNERLAVQVPVAAQGATPAAAPAETAAAKYESVRKDTDRRLAGLARFLTDKMREELDAKYTDAIKLAKDKTDEGYEAATVALTKLHESLDDDAPQIRAAATSYLRNQIKRDLDNEGGVLLKNDKKGFVERFAPLDKDLPINELDAEAQLGALRKLSSDLDGAVQVRLKAIGDLCVDYERLLPIVKRALTIEGPRHGDLADASQELEVGFAFKFIHDGLTIDEIKSKLTGMEKIVHDIFENFMIDDAMEEQKQSLPASLDSLKPKGDALGKGNFGEVFELANDGSTKLVGKSFQANNADAKKEMEREAEIYARIGEHPNIAKCYGIHEVDDPLKGTSSMLVMDKIEGKDVDKVFDDLNERYREKKISREEYLAATQHIFKGTLMGLAHMEAMGLVHKDIKSDNVKFDTRTNQAVLIDMGLAQTEGIHEVKKFFPPIAPPEQFTKQLTDQVVTPLWDSFTVGKMLFEEMERDDEGNRHALVTGNTPIVRGTLKELAQRSPEFTQASRVAVKRTNAGEFEAQTDAKGQMIGQALKYTEDMKKDPNARSKDAEARKKDPDALKKHGETLEKAVDAGEYRAMTQYVDFMNRLTHPDPKQRMSPSEALKHPFMTDTFLSGEELDRVFGKPMKAESAVAVSSDKDKKAPRHYDDDADAKKKPQEQKASKPPKTARYYSDEADEADTEEKPQSKSARHYDDDADIEIKPQEQKVSNQSKSDRLYDDEADTEEQPQEQKVSKQPKAAKVQPTEDVEAAPMKGTTALQRWQVAQQQVEQQFNTAYSNLGGDKAKLKAAGFTKGNKFSDYFTYNKDLDKLVKSLEEAKKKSSKDVPKIAAKVTAATQHYREKIIRKADTDFCWANAAPAVHPPFWKTLVAALNDIDKWVKS